MRPKTLLLLVVAIACGLVAAFMVNQISGGSKGANMVDVLVPKADIPQGTKIDVKNMFQVKPFPKESVPLTAVTQAEKLEGKVLARTLTANFPVTDRDLYSNTNILRELEPGYRAMTVRATIETALHGFLQAGSRVDVLTIVRDAHDNQKSESKIFLQNVKVLAVNTLSDRLEDKPTVPNPVSITLMLKPEQIERLFLVSSRGQVGVVLRKPGDSEKVETPGASSPFSQEEAGPGGPGSSPPVQVAVAIKDIPDGRTIEKFDDYFKMLSFNKSQLLGAVITDRSEVEGKRLTRFLAMGQPASRANFTPLGVEAPSSRDTHQLTIINGQRTEVHTFGDNAPRTTLPQGKPDDPPPAPKRGGSEAKDEG